MRKSACVSLSFSTLVGQVEKSLGKYERFRTILDAKQNFRLVMSQTQILFDTNTSG